MPFYFDSVSLTPNSPRWVGAWWIGFLISGLLAFVVAFPMCGFPTKLPGVYGSSQFKINKTFCEKNIDTFLVRIVRPILGS